MPPTTDEQDPGIVPDLLDTFNRGLAGLGGSNWDLAIRDLASALLGPSGLQGCSKSRCLEIFRAIHASESHWDREAYRLELVGLYAERSQRGDFRNRIEYVETPKDSARALRRTNTGGPRRN